MKYIMLKIVQGKGPTISRLVPFIFPDFLVHADIAHYMTFHLTREHKASECTAVSAGFIDLDAEKTHGESETLKIKAHEDDAATINAYSYFHGIL